MPRTARPGRRADRKTPGTRQRSDKYFSKVIGKALDVIAILRSDAEPLPLMELTLRLELAKSSVFRILHTLEVSRVTSSATARALQRGAGVCGTGRPAVCEPRSSTRPCRRCAS